MVSERQQTAAARRRLAAEQARSNGPTLGQTEITRHILVSLWRSTRARSVLLLDGGREILVQVGNLSSAALSQVWLVLEAGAEVVHPEWSAEVGPQLSFHQRAGEENQVYAAVSTNGAALIVVMPRQTSSRQEGLVWLFMRHALQELGEIFAGEGGAVSALGSLTAEQARALGLLSEEAEEKRIATE